MTEPYEILCDGYDLAEWYDKRNLGIGASEAAACLGESPWCSARELFERKSNPAAFDPLEGEHLEWGHRLEGPIAEAYQERTGRSYQCAQQLLRSTKYPWMLATLDGLTDCNEADEGCAIISWPLELKNISEYAADEWEEGAPLHYRIQCHQQMIVTGTKRVTICALIGGRRMVWEDIEWNQALADRIIAATRKMSERIHRGDPPAPDGSSSAKRILAGLYPQDDGEAIAGDLSDDELVAAWQRAKAAAANAEREAEKHKQQIQDRMKSATMLALPSGAAVTWKTQTKKAFTVAANTSRVMRFRKAK